MKSIEDFFSFTELWCSLEEESLKSWLTGALSFMCAMIKDLLREFQLNSNLLFVFILKKWRWSTVYLLDLHSGLKEIVTVVNVCQLWLLRMSLSLWFIKKKKKSQTFLHFKVYLSCLGNSFSYVVFLNDGWDISVLYATVDVNKDYINYFSRGAHSVWHSMALAYSVL